MKISKKILVTLLVATTCMFTGCSDDSGNADDPRENVDSVAHRPTGGNTRHIEEPVSIIINEPSPPRMISRPCRMCSGRGYEMVHISVPNYSGIPDESGRISSDEWIKQSCAYCDGTGMVVEME